MLYHLTLLLPCTMCLIGAAWLICKWKSNTKAQNILALCFLLTSVFFFCTANYIGGVSDYVTYRSLDILDCLLTPFIIPSMYLYFRSLTYEGRFTWKDYIWFLPAFVIGIGTCVLYQAMDETQTAGYIESVLINQSPDGGYDGPIYRLHYFITIELYSYFALAQIVGTATCAIVYLQRYHYRLREFHSALDNKSVDLDNTILFWFMLTIPFALCVTLVKESFWREHPVITGLFFTGYAIVYFGITYNGSQRKYSVENLAQDIHRADCEAEKYACDLSDEDVTFRTNKYTQFFGSFQKLMEEERIFLQTNLRADELAAKMHTNRTYLSQMFRDEFKCTFYEYINRKRIEYAQRLMVENPDIKVKDLAEQSGFINVNSFERTFNQFTGSSPKKWLKNSASKG